MKLLWNIGSYFALCALTCLLQSVPSIMQSAPLAAVLRLHQPAEAQPNSQPPSQPKPQNEVAQNAPRDGQHDFDFNLGTWHSHIKRLQHPLTGSTTWTEMQGNVVVRKVWDGRAQLEEIEADGAAGHFEGLTLFLYNPEAHQWSQYFSNSSDGTISQPAVGEFKNGRGEFYDQEPYNGRAILVRVIWSDITPDSHRFEQSFSADGGKTWEPNFIATLTRAGS